MLCSSWPFWDRGLWGIGVSSAKVLADWSVENGYTRLDKWDWACGKDGRIRLYVNKWASARTVRTSNTASVIRLRQRGAIVLMLAIGHFTVFEQSRLDHLHTYSGERMILSMLPRRQETRSLSWIYETCTEMLYECTKSLPERNRKTCVRPWVAIRWYSVVGGLVWLFRTWALLRFGPSERFEP
jgi:hypothetical protein